MEFKRRDLEKRGNQIIEVNKHRDAQLLVYIEPMCFTNRIRSIGLISGCFIASVAVAKGYIVTRVQTH